VSAVYSTGRTIWIADAHRGDGKRFVVRADEKLTAAVELESAMTVLVKVGVDNQEEKEEQHVESSGDRQ
jgi:hypothetical protein